MTSDVVFRSRRSTAGIVSSLVFIAMCLTPLALVVGAGRIPLEALVGCGIGLAGALWAAFILGLLWRMRYRFADADLVVSCGPYHWSIKYGEIMSAALTNLKYHPTSTGWKLPGLALFNVFYADRGTVRMCAASITRRILLIETPRGFFGITPEDPEAFLAEMERRRRR